MKNNLGTCRYCGKEIARTATKCPHCGGGGNPALTSAQYRGVVLLSIIIGIGVWIYMTTYSDSAKAMKKFEQSMQQSQNELSAMSSRMERDLKNMR